MLPHFNPLETVRLNGKQKTAAVAMCALTVAGMYNTLEMNDVWLMLGIGLAGSTLTALAIILLMNKN